MTPPGDQPVAPAPGDAHRARQLLERREPAVLGRAVEQLVQDHAAAEVVDQVGDGGGRDAVAALEHPAEQQASHPGPRRQHAHRGRAAERRAEAERPHEPA